MLTLLFNQATPLAGAAGIASGEAFGADGKLNLRLTGAAGIASGEAFGAGGRMQLRLVGAAGIASGEVFGADGKLNLRLTGAAGIASGEAFGAGGNITARQPVPDFTFYGIAEQKIKPRLKPRRRRSQALEMRRGIASAEIFGADGAALLRLPLAPAALLAAIPHEASKPELRLVGGMGIASGEALGLNGAIRQQWPELTEADELILLAA